MDFSPTQQADRLATALDLNDERGIAEQERNTVLKMLVCALLSNQ
jgi:hypothetical protein